MFVPNLYLTSTKKENTAEVLGGNQHRIESVLSVSDLFNVQTVPNDIHEEVFGKLSVQ